MTATDAFGCVNNTIYLRSGKYLDLAYPRPEQFEFRDIAGALSKICRFGGQCNYFYSVAEHSYWCAIQARRDGLPLDVQAACLLHDAAEAFIGDCVKPLKIMLPDYANIEAAMEGAIAEKFLIDFDRESVSVRKIDREMLIAERRSLFSADRIEWTGENQVRRLEIYFSRWSPAEAEVRFQQKALEIGINVNV